MLRDVVKNRLGSVLISGALALSVTSHAAAEQNDTHEQLSIAITAFEDSFANGNYLALMEMFAPRLMDAIIARSDLRREAALQTLADRSATAMADLTVIEITMDMTDSKIATSDGLTYALVPTVIVTEREGVQVRMTSMTLGLKENGIWSLSRIMSPQQETDIKTLYPEISGVTFPRILMETVN